MFVLRILCEMTISYDNILFIKLTCIKKKYFNSEFRIIHNSLGGRGGRGGERCLAHDSQSWAFYHIVIRVVRN